ncbi:nucleotidyltransferase [Holzapfeliella sp. He02]|uniref:tRNA(Met) cytidine acetate ligase n=1 Tax=Holzapfeliella saturejae TaxID=3082953 RepID=A0ABU8SGW8_9LACO
MSVTGVIAEFNPFHSGHEFLMNQARLVAQDDPIIVVMSGNYVQRGDIAITDKWTRTDAALAAGADLVVELPFHHAVQPADRFATGAIEILAGLGVETLVFGAENARLNFESLGQKISDIRQKSADFSDYTQTYAAQYNDTIANELGYEVNRPNTLLAIAYSVANVTLNTQLRMHPVRRLGVDHDQPLEKEQPVASASAIRKALNQNQDLKEEFKNWLPQKELSAILAQPNFPDWEMLFPFLKYKIESTSATDLAQIYQMTEGLENRMKQVIHQTDSFEEFLMALKSKRYTYARLRRLALYCLLNISDEQVRNFAKKKYIRVLGYSKLGRRHLKRVKKQTDFSIISRVNKKNANKDGELALEVQVDRLYEQIAKQTSQNFGRRPIERK